IMIAHAQGANVIAIDISPDKLEMAKSLGASVVIDARGTDVVRAVLDHSGGGAHASIDALGSPVTCFNSIACLRKRGRHVQVGLMLGDHHHPAIPMDKVIAKELEILGSHGMQAHRYPTMLEMIRAGTLEPHKLIGRTISLGETPAELADMDSFKGTGVTVIDRFS
ncbi:MAG TPA: zinc-binding dehydrogenase, partial [Magnetospirillaceae bacterium]|nr:zinc-binding dehydrogenase [Magnetospirillaceae bacterium]